MKRRVALFFDHSVPHTTGHYWAGGFRQLGCGVTVLYPSQAASLAPGSYDLFLSIDDATHYLFPGHLHPSAFSLSDTHMGYRADRVMARWFDFIFCVHKDGAARLKQDGIPRVSWVPVACAPELHVEPAASKRYDVAFVGGEGWGRRRRLVRTVRERFPNAYIGRASPRDMAGIYSESRIVFNCGIKNDLNMRVFEALASGACLVTNLDAAGLADLFEPGVHFAGYETDEEAIGQIERYLRDDAAREAIARAGRAEVLAKHT
ncbi:MAG: glycosyltransferase family 1 protein, partial [Elusimicrobia bacterium]|nr:glycosyltransferase family 1 protein [Elusimicrobiota bacterium]